MASVKSLVAAIDGNLSGMSKADLVLTCKMLEGGRAAWRKEFEAERVRFDALWQILVMLKRDLDPHETNPDKLEFDRDTWKAAVDRANALKPV